jgi:predicted nucleotidyltransferase
VYNAKGGNFARHIIKETLMVTPPFSSEQVRQTLAEFCRRHKVQELALFGSAVRGELQPNSDLDLLVTFAPDARVGFLALSRMARELSELLGRPVDLVPKEGLKPAIREAVLAEAETLYAT